jgi:hypothetical protein
MASDLTKEFLHRRLKANSLSEKKIDVILSNIKNLSFSSFKDFNFEDEKKYEFTLTDSQKLRLKNTQDDIVLSNDLRETMVKFLARKFVRTQYELLDNLKLEELNINPFMVMLLGLRTPEEVVGYFARSNIFISIATSLGFYLEHFLIDGHQNVEKLKEGFDARKTKNDVTYEMEFKSGPNDVNKTAMRQYNTDFLEKEKQNIKPILGMLYGSRDKSMALTHAENELDKPDEWVKVGKEIWEFVSGEKNHHSKVMRWMDEAVDDLNFSNRILDQVELTVSRLAVEFEKEFGKGEKGVQKYISKSM